ncbi:hypothetical protein MTO96_042247 [Rhipicephalus appendiculatus]
MVIAKLEVTYAMDKPLLFNPEFVAQVKQERASMSIDLEAPNFELTGTIKDAQNAASFFQQDSVPAVETSEKAVAALDADSAPTRVRYVQSNAPVKFLMVDDVTTTHLDLMRQLMGFLESRFRLMYPSCGVTVAAQAMN